MTMRTRYLFLICLSLLEIFSAANLTAQNLSMTSSGKVELHPTDMDATAYYPLKDQNDELCALIKVRLTHELEYPLVLENGALGVSKREERPNGEIWFWVPYRTKNLFFSSKGYAPVEPIPVQLTKGKVYRITLDNEPIVPDVIIKEVPVTVYVANPEQAVGPNLFIEINMGLNMSNKPKFENLGNVSFGDLSSEDLFNDMTQGDYSYSTLGVSIGYRWNRWGAYLSGLWGSMHNELGLVIGPNYTIPGEQLNYQLYAGGGFMKTQDSTNWLGDLGIRATPGPLLSKYRILTLSLGFKFGASYFAPTFGVGLNFDL